MKLYKLTSILLFLSLITISMSCTSSDEEEKNFSNLLNTLKTETGIIGDIYNESINSLRNGLPYMTSTLKAKENELICSLPK